jgi:hypothetical protein
MTGQNKDENRLALLRLADEMIDDILATSDEEILAEFKESYGDPINFANKMRSKVDLLAIGANKDRLITARHKLESEKRLRNVTTLKIDIQIMRQALTKFFSKAPGSVPVTVAARKEKITEMSDDDVVGMVADLEELGFVLRAKKSGD